MRGLLALLVVLGALGVSGRAPAAEFRSSGGFPALVVEAPAGSISRADADLVTVSPASGPPPGLILSVKSVDTKIAGAVDGALADRVAAGFFKAWAGAGSTMTGPIPDGQVNIAGRPASRYRGAMTTPDGHRADVEVAVVLIDASHIGALILIGTTGEATTAALEKAMMAATLTDH